MKEKKVKMKDLDKELKATKLIIKTLQKLPQDKRIMIVRAARIILGLD